MKAFQRGTPRCRRRGRRERRGEGAGQGPGAADVRRVAGAAGPRLPVSTVLLVGAGEVGVRAARQLLDTPGVDRVIVGARNGARAHDVARALRRRRRERSSCTRAAPLPEGVDAIASALPGRRRHVDRRCRGRRRGSRSRPWSRRTPSRSSTLDTSAARARRPRRHRVRARTRALRRARASRGERARHRRRSARRAIRGRRATRACRRRAPRSASRCSSGATARSCSERGHGARADLVPRPGRCARVRARGCRRRAARRRGAGRPAGVGAPRSPAHADDQAARPVRRAHAGPSGSRCRLGRRARRGVGIAGTAPGRRSSTA